MEAIVYVDDMLLPRFHDIPPHEPPFQASSSPKPRMNILISAGHRGDLTHI